MKYLKRFYESNGNEILDFCRDILKYQNNFKL
jgi:hypothetical protein